MSPNTTPSAPRERASEAGCGCLFRGIRARTIGLRLPGSGDEVTKGVTMSGSRREFLMTSCAALLAPAAAQEPVPGSPPAFGTAPPVGPEVGAATFAEAGK